MKPGVPYVPQPMSTTVRFGLACALAAFTLTILHAMFAPDVSNVGAIFYCTVAGVSGITAIYQIVRLAQTVDKES